MRCTAAGACAAASRSALECDWTARKDMTEDRHSAHWLDMQACMPAGSAVPPLPPPPAGAAGAAAAASLRGPPSSDAGAPRLISQPLVLFQLPNSALARPCARPGHRPHQPLRQSAIGGTFHAADTSCSLLFVRLPREPARSSAPGVPPLASGSPAGVAPRGCSEPQPTCIKATRHGSSGSARRAGSGGGGGSRRQPRRPAAAIRGAAAGSVDRARLAARQRGGAGLPRRNSSAVAHPRLC